MRLLGPGRGQSTGSTGLVLALVTGVAAGCVPGEEPGPMHDKIITVAPSTSYLLGGEPAQIFLWYADGSPAPAVSTACPGTRPPAFNCAFAASTEACQRQVQAYLDRWYADLNVVFTLTKPQSGHFFSLIITSQGTWCDQEPSVAGIAPWSGNVIEDGVANALQCGHNAQACAVTIAHEHGHMVGLEHTDSANDIMYPDVTLMADGFQNVLNRTAPDAVRSTQNSFAMMLNNLGPWAGGAKPGPFGSLSPDGGATTASPYDATASSAGGLVPAGGNGTPMTVTSDAQPMSRGFTYPADASPATMTESSPEPAGCSAIPSARPSFPTALLLALLAWLLSKPLLPTNPTVHHIVPTARRRPRRPARR